MSTQYSSPGIDTNERDVSLTITAPDTTTVGSVGEFSWGAVGVPLFISNENNLQNVCGKPTETNVRHFMSAVDALTYTSNLVLIRTINEDSAKNASCLEAKSGILIKNRSEFSTLSTSQKTGHKFAAKYPSHLGNSLEVSLADSKTFKDWEYDYLFSAPPGTSDYAKRVGAKNDEVHIVVIDRGGLFTGTPNTILEKYEFLSKARDGKSLDLNNTYFVNHINEQSKYIYVMSMPTDYDDSVSEAKTDWGSTLIDQLTGESAHFKSAKVPDTGLDGSSAPSSSNPHNGFGGRLAGGTLGDPADDSDYIKSWNIYRNSEETSVGILYLGAVKDEYIIRLSQHIIDRIIGQRKDCVFTVTPPLEKILNKIDTDALSSIYEFHKELNRESSYTFMTCNWFLQYNQHTDSNHWIPDNVGTAGLMARTDQTNEPWFSPAGYTRGVYRNVIKTAWNPSEEIANELYKISINRVANFRGHGTILFGDKTLLTRPSALRQIGVRRLLIQLKKLISNASKYTLFEFNDSTTRNRFISLVRPYLLQVQAGRGIDSFDIVCDENNNTGQVINEQRFVADIFIRPTYSINRINLNFILVNNTTSFTEAVG